jgi:RsiW-degrading membrane proteinase PrsW (M82 family)
VATLLVANAGLATVLAALIAPVVYVASIRHADVPEGKPFVAVVSTVLAGGLVGAGLAWLTRLYLTQLSLAQVTAMAQGMPPLSLVLFLGITMPLVGELLKLAGPLLLRRWPSFRDEVIDGVVFGIASGVGFAAGSTLVNYWPIIRGGYAPTGAAAFSEWTATLLGLTIVRPLVHGAATGLIGAGIWAATLRRGSGIFPVLVGLGGSVGYSLGELLLLSWGTLVVLALHGLVLALLLLTLWRTIREALLLDARMLGLQPH